MMINLIKITSSALIMIDLQIYRMGHSMNHIVKISFISFLVQQPSS